MIADFSTIDLEGLICEWDNSEWPLDVEVNWEYVSLTRGQAEDLRDWLNARLAD